MIETFLKYNGSGMMLSWFLIAWLYLFLAEKDKPKRIMLVYTPALVLLIFFNPLFYRFCSRLTEEAIYFRILWLVPVTIVIAYSILRIMGSLQKKKRIVFGLVAVVGIILAGKPVYVNPLFSVAENSYHVPDEVVEICDTIRIEGREVMAAFPPEFLLYVRQYSPYVCMPYGREEYKGSYTEFYSLICQEEIDVEQLAAFAKGSGCHYVILSKEKELLGKMSDYQYEVFEYVGNYVVYRDSSMDFSVK